MTTQGKTTEQAIIERKLFEGERSLYGAQELMLKNCVFAHGESPLKEGKQIKLESCHFEWKYPLWYCDSIRAEGCLWLEMARSGVWYSDDVFVSNSLIQAPKNFRRCRDVRLDGVTFTDAAETLWMCSDVKLDRVQARGDYFCMNSKDIEVENLSLTGNYCFDGASNVTVRDSKLISKDAFWNTRNVTIYDSTIVGEYLGWNSENLTLVNCTIESLQGLCYVHNLKMINCKTINTTLAFERSDVDVELTSRIDGVFNPNEGRISCEGIEELILEPDQTDPSKTKIICTEETTNRKSRAPWRA